mmetsp:Transcript_55038/g.98130  ORF Transcript_55038/g.98130 Transcript_55038/m.98130 type:complete len:803 (-) Transcript_55038:117-2525(-)
MSRAYPIPRPPARRPEGETPGAKSTPRRPAGDAASNCNGKAPLTAVWVGADAVKVLAGPALSSLTYIPSAEDQRNGDSNSKDAAVSAHECRARELLSQRQPVAALAELEAALCLCEKRGLETAVDIRRRWQTLTASAVAWSLDFLADAGLASEKSSDGAGLPASDQALEMLCLAEMLTRKEVAETFGAQGMPSRTFLRALSHCGLGAYYHLRQKPRAAISFLEQAANGAARWAHPAILLNLCAAYLLLKEPGPALAALSQAVLALRSSTGRLCGESMDEVDAAAQAARTAVAAVLGPSPSEDMGSQNSAALLEMDPFGHGLALRGEDGLERVVPGSLLESTQGSGGSSQGSAGRSARQRGQVQPTASKKDKRHGLGQHGLVSKVPTSRGQDTFEYEADAAVARTLLAVKVLLRPWPEFGEQEAVANGAVATSSMRASAQAQVNPLTSSENNDLQAQLSEMAGARIALCASRLKKAWPQWGKPVPSADVPGGGLVMRECLLLSFLHAAAALAQLCSEPVYGLWVIPPLREGLALAIVLFGPKHPLAFKLINACQRVTPQVSRPATSSGTGRGRGSGQPRGSTGRDEDVQRAGRSRPSSVPSSQLRASAAPTSKAATVDRGSHGRQRSPPKAKSKKDPVTTEVIPTPRGRRDLTPKALEVPEGVNPAVLHMQLNSPRSGHARGERQRSLTPILRSRSQSLEREMRRIHSQAGAEARRDLRPQTSPAMPVGLGHRLRARAAGGSKIGGPPACAQSMPSTPRSQSPGQGSPLSREPIWQMAKRRRESERGLNARKAEKAYEEALGL